MTGYSDIVVDSPKSGVQHIRLNRPEAHNALRTALLGELANALSVAEQDDQVRVVVITGSEKVFAAGADIKEMADLNPVGIWKDKRPQHWNSIKAFSKPVIAAVNGYCLGGGMELAMSADIIIASEDAQFGQPEINLGIIPGAGGTQRLIRSVGKALAMKLILSGEFIKAREALYAGLVAEVTQPELTLKRATTLAKTIASKSPIAVRVAKEAILAAYETPLSQGLELERKAFLFLAATEDRQEGIQAFMEKRPPQFKGL
ncbi:2,3-dehydroadipyl-CoA hydratase PaaF [Sedimenticola selenatireducens]|uniref:2,3-dehydroadipyl-CoA hydratase n=1 Tax=Sedimenticola selenatireducens TaxID=191960 RepID=A0A557RYL5_9GAMM|nr:2,3-dehydroadipyl-CoA hydratase PaaF [Sedimenticola selenatireducens]TVO70231.1 2,3-dehydroadipyl-CoA hydratase [Sedimenticola selenatireducens]TVT61134.1 MAG: 2,3-dehydroadipyl-CoA hydratase [Sedimenticola selenatireducens]